MTERGSEAVGDVVIIAKSGTLVSAADAWTYIAEGAIVSVTPNSGQTGTRVVIGGGGLLGGGSVIATVLLAGESAKVESSGEAVVEAIAGAGNDKSGDVVITADSGAETSKADGWTYVVAGTISEISPSSGHYGTRTTITGANLFGGGESIIAVTLGDEAAEIVSSDANTIKLVAGASAESKQGDVVVISSSGATTTLVGGWLYVKPGQILFSTPEEGQEGQKVTISGLDLLGGGSTFSYATLAGVRAKSVEGNQFTATIVADLADAGTTGDLTLVADY